MSESDSERRPPSRLAPPFPSRKELHAARIPQRPETVSAADVPQTPPSPLPKRSQASTVRREPPRRPRTVAPEPALNASPEPEQPPVTPGIVSNSQPVSEPPDEPTKTSFKPVISPKPVTKTADEAAKVPSAAAKEPAPAPKQRPPERTGSKETRLTFKPLSGQSIEVSMPAVAPDPAEPSPFPKRVSPITGSQPSLAAASTSNPKPKPSNGDKRRRRRRRRVWTALIALIVIAAVGVGGFWAIKSLQGGPTVLKTEDDYPAVNWETDAADHPSVEVTVEPGQLGSEIGTMLVEADVVKTLKAFTRAFDSNPASASIKPGTYTLPIRIPAADALAALLDETNRSENTITVNPGQTVDQIAEKMISVAGFTEEEVQQVVDAPEDVTALPEEAGGNLEGWLWPGAYDFSPGGTPAEVFNEMVEPTVAYLEENNVPVSDRQEVLIKASIVEREVNRTEDMPKVARVIENRIADPEGPTRGMLQMDSTVTYGVGGTGGLPDSAAFEDDNPYNTYRVKGLPAGPIASPSEDAIQAVLHPAEGEWLYFVTVNLNTGETVFTDSHDELQELTEQLSAWCEENPGECRR